MIRKRQNTPPPPGRSPGKNRFKRVPFVITFVVMMFTWLALSGKFDLFHLSLGVLSCAIVSFISSDLLITATSFKGIPTLWFRFFLYLPWLVKEILLANLHLLKLVFSRDLEEKINPQIIDFRSKMKDQMGLVTFANSITLTPGTITVSLSTYGDYVVHAIDDASAEPLPGEMERRVAHVFGGSHHE
ncbi:MAG: Na+/H+ antiporter subunit E [Desulfobacterales bacterium]|nr:Na+/H+ antiporter subunit E [Desulfobacterales bacterium]